MLRTRDDETTKAEGTFVYNDDRDAPSTLTRRHQDRGWTPARLAEALRNCGLPGSCATLKRACAAGEIPHTRSKGGHIRIEPAWIERTFPSLIKVCG